MRAVSAADSPIGDAGRAGLAAAFWTLSRPEPVETRLLLQEISAKISKYIVLRREAVIATALWTMTAWAHEGTTHSPVWPQFLSNRFRQTPSLVFYVF